METTQIISWLYDKAARAQDHSYARMLNMTAKRLKELDEKQRWIPVTERLPKEDGSYLVRTASGTVTTARFYAFKSFPANKYLPAIHRNAAWQSNRNVTHWMPLPEPPKEVE